ncbi:unnamed protein product [Caenorhabditis angaria]|uniref:Uncharacterized protein n=1 Tax=Caenorhabditis angaria TaxID=860376 RepID=A0A9P1N9D9_9PELO|nr:unnamed protein product [Caenorhabditis angaria]
MDISTTFKDAVYRNKRILTSDKLYGLVVENTDDEIKICHGKTLYNLSRRLPFPQGSKRRKNQEKFPQAHVHKNIVTVMSQAAAPNSNCHLNLLAQDWKFLAWSTEWDVIGDPHLLFNRFSKDKIFNVRLIFNRGRQPVHPQTDYLWEVVEIFNCFDSNSHFQMLRAPWNIGTQNLKVEKENNQPKIGFVHRVKVVEENTCHFVTTQDGKSIPILANSAGVKIGQWIEYHKTIQLGMKSDRAFAKKVLEIHQRGQIEIEKFETTTEEIFEIEFEFNLNSENNYDLLKFDEFYIKDASVNKIHISKTDLNSSLLRLKSHQKGVDFLQKTDVLLCLARYVWLSEEGIMCWKFWNVLSISRI